MTWTTGHPLRTALFPMVPSRTDPHISRRTSRRSATGRDERPDIGWNPASTSEKGRVPLN